MQKKELVRSGLECDKTKGQLSHLEKLFSIQREPKYALSEA